MQNLNRRRIMRRLIRFDTAFRCPIKRGLGIYGLMYCIYSLINESRHEIFNNVVCATSKGSDHFAHTRNLIRAFASQYNIFMNVKLLTGHHLQFLILKGGCTGSSESTLVTIPHCWKSHLGSLTNSFLLDLMDMRVQDVKVSHHSIVSLNYISIHTARLLLVESTKPASQTGTSSRAQPDVSPSEQPGPSTLNFSLS